MLIKGNCQIAGIGIYLPEQIVTSQELMREIKSEQNYGISENWIDEVCGIEERRVATPEEAPSFMAIKAAEEALKKSGVQPSEIDAVIFCGISRDWIEPSVAHKVQHELGCTNAISFDVTNACHGFMNGVLIADNLMQTSDADHVLVVTGEVPSEISLTYVDELKKGRPFIRNEVGSLTVGDAGAAMILTPKASKAGFQYYNFYTNAKYSDLCKISQRKDGGYEGQMVMGKISSIMFKMHENLVQQTYNTLNWSSADLSHLVCHQVGKKPHQRMIAMANVSQEIAPVSYKNLGNITTATIPINLYNLDTKINDKVFIAGAGSGLSISQSGLIF